MFVPEELLFNIFLSYQRKGNFAHRPAAFQTQMGFIEVSASPTSLKFYGTAPATRLLLARCPSTAPPGLRSPGCSQHPRAARATFLLERLRCCFSGPHGHPGSRGSVAPSSSFCNSPSGGESKRQHEKERKKKEVNSAGMCSSCAVDNISWGPPGDELGFNWHRLWEGEKGV